MKIWELTSAFRNEPNILLKVLKQPKWSKYYIQYLQLKEINQKQGREKIDDEIPFELCYEVAEKSIQEYWLSYKEDPQVLYNYRPNIEDVERLLPKEILIRFGGDKMGKAQEYSMTYVQPRPLNKNVEVIESFIFLKGEMLSILRAEYNVDIENCLLSTNDDTKRWIVNKELKDIFVDPYSAYEKLKAQRNQNIRQFFLIGLNHSEKPMSGEILRIIK